MVKRGLVRQLSDVKDWFNSNKHSVLSFDTETTSLKYMELDIEFIQFFNGEDGIVINLVDNPERKDILDYINSKLQDSITKIIAHNIVFDLKVFHKLGLNTDNCDLYCTMVADHLINENRQSHSLKHLAKELLGEEEVVTYEKARSYGLESTEFYNYSMNDVIWTWKLYQLQRPILVRENLATLFKTIEMPFQRVLVDMEINGMLIDKAKVTETTELITNKLIDFTVEMCDELNISYQTQYDLVGGMNIVCPTNFNSAQQLAKIIYDDLGFECKEFTKAGARKIDKPTISKLKDKHPFLETLYKYKIAQKLLSAFFKPLPSHVDSDGRVRPSFRDTGTVTGRLSCSNPNLQQLPKEAKEFPINTRSAFIAGEGRKLIVSDFSGQEICVAAELSQDPTLINSLHNGADVHLAVANSSFELGIPEECLNKNHHEYKSYKEKFKKERFNAKCITFGLLYGKGAYGFAKDFDITEKEAQVMIDNFFKGMPQVKEAITKTHQEVRSKGYVTYMSGRQRHFKKETLWNKNTNESFEGYSQRTLRQTFNACVQGFSADMMRMAMIAIHKEAKKHTHWDFKIIATVHDEIIAECKEKYADEVAAMVKREMENSVSFAVPITADTEITNDYGEAK